MVGFTVDDDADRHSVHSIASTVATTTSLASRIRDLNLDFGDKLQEHAGEGEQEEEEQKDPAAQANGAGEEGGASEHSDHHADRVGAAGGAHHVPEDDLGVPHSLHLLHRDPPLQPLQVCCRLFDRRSHPPLPLKRMTMAQVEDFRQHGYVVLDGLLSKEAAARIKAEAGRLSQRGMLQPVSLDHLGVMSNNNNSSSNSNAAAAGGGAALANGTSSSMAACNGCSSSNGYSVASSSSNHSISGTQQPALGLASSPHCRNGISSSASSNGPPPGFTQGMGAGSNCSSSSSSNGRMAAAGLQQRHLQQQQQSAQASLQQQQQQQQQRWSELRMPLLLGHPPADTAVFAPLMAAMQELQEDLSEFVRLRSRGSAEYCLCQLPSGSHGVPRHKDALPDDGGAVAGSGGRQEGGGAGAGSSTPLASVAAAAAAAAASLQLQQQQQQQQPQSPLSQQQSQSQQQHSIARQQQPQQPPPAAPPAASTPPVLLGPTARRVSMFAFVNPDWDKECGGVVRLWPPSRPSGPPSTSTAAASAARRSPTSSDAGTTFSEISDCGSLRFAFLGSTTSSVIAEASAPDHDTYSLDGISVADSEAERATGFEWVECEGGEMALDVAPLAGRVLLVLSGAVEHSLLPGSGTSPGCDTVFVRAWCC